MRNVTPLKAKQLCDEDFAIAKSESEIVLLDQTGMVSAPEIEARALRIHFIDRHEGVSEPPAETVRFIRSRSPYRFAQSTRGRR